MTSLDMSLMERAEPHFCDAFATYDRGDGDLVRTAQEITMAGKMAGFTKNGRRRMLDYLCGFIDTLDERGIDPIAQGNRVDDPSTLFARDRLGGLFNEEVATRKPVQAGLFDASDKDDEERDRALVDQLIADTRLYDSAKAIKELLEFTVRLRHIAPFNAMLLHIQKPGLSFAARPKDWWERFRRRPMAHARPLVVLRNFGPVEFVYDILDTEGEPLPEAAFSFPTSGDVPEGWLAAVDQKLSRAEITIIWLDRGDYTAGHARRLTSHGDKKRLERFEVGVNRNHSSAAQLVTLAHELAHIFLGHCGGDEKRGVKFNRPEDVALREVEAETVAYLVAKRTGVSPRSESYLDRYQGAFDQLDLHRILKVASMVEKELNLPFRDLRIFQ
ncbi:MAG: ImmA/IrrE family metallo-endopeptidase [Gammaproteobacteria bacterium]